MKARRRYGTLLVYGAVLLAGLAGGLACSAPCDGYYCLSDVTGCTIQSQFAINTCCVNINGNGFGQCATCKRFYYVCDGGSPVLGPAVDCMNFGSRCY